MENAAIAIEEKANILEDIVNQLSLNDRYLVRQYIAKEKIPYEDLARIRNLEKAMSEETEDWWNSSFPQKRAYMQFMCSTQIINYDIYRQDMQKLLGRCVTNLELYEREKIRDEVESQYAKWRQ
ncbi:MAG: hypothetical protein E7311_03595 [Clostridiales bacterium]|nr:hypothetical protein [Clostridiales bacterium]